MATNSITAGISQAKEASLFRTLRHRLIRSMLRDFLQQSRLRVVLLLGLTALFWLAMFILFYEAFALLVTAIGHAPTLARTVHAVYNVFFLSLLFMVGVSSGILFYGAVYKSEDVRLLLTTPARTSTIAIFKYQEAMLLACWGFILLGSPLLIAYGIVNAAPWHYYLLLLPFLLSFSSIAAGLGVTGCLLLMYFAPRRRLQGITILGIVGVGIACYLAWGVFKSDQNEMLSIFWLQQTLDRFQLAEQRMLPSWWLSTGLLESAHSQTAIPYESLGLLCVLISNGLAASLLIGYLGSRLLRRSYGNLVAGPGIPIRFQTAWLDRAIQRLLRPLPQVVRLILLKDLRLFRRDPLQWTQFLLFFGLLCLYFFYVRRFNYANSLMGWMTAIGFMNLGVVGLILSTFTTRFVFPMISIEGYRFWILGTLPIHRTTILWSKFFFATLVSCLPCCLLILLSDLALQLWVRTPIVVILHQILCICMGFALAGLSVGMGAYLPNLKESSPARVAAGFGGTLTLVISAILIVAIILPPAVASYFWVISEYTSRSALLAVFITITTSILISIISTIIPMRLGFRAFRTMELR